MSGHVKLEQLKSGHVKIFLDPKFILPWKSLELNCLAPTFLWTYTFKTKIILGLTFFSQLFFGHIFLDPKFLGPKSFGAKLSCSEFFFYPIFKDQKNFGPAFSGSIIFWVSFFWPNLSFGIISFLDRNFFCDPTFFNTVFDTTQTKMHLSIVLWLLRGPTCFIWFCKLSFYRALDI